LCKRQNHPVDADGIAALTRGCWLCLAQAGRLSARAGGLLHILPQYSRELLHHKIAIVIPG